MRKIRLISKFMTSQRGKQTIAIHIFTNIWRSKDNQAMKSDRLIEYNMKNIFLEKSYSKWGGETIVRPFSKKSKLSIYTPRIIEIYWNWAVDYLLLPHTKLFKKTKRSLELVSLRHFLHEKCFSCCVLLPDQISLSCCF